jgi:hypothetical protein
VATLPDGRVALFGGHGTGFTALNSAEIWSPSTDSFTTLTMQYTHDWAAFASLSDGRFLLAGGSANLGIPQYATSELFDPATGTFTAVGNLVRFRSGSGAAALSNGTVLIAGAWWTHNDAHTYGELFTPAPARSRPPAPCRLGAPIPWCCPQSTAERWCSAGSRRRAVPT